MQDSKIREIPGEIMQRQLITIEDVQAMRRGYFHDGVVSPTEAQMLFELNDTCSQQDPAWVEFFIEALTDYCVHQADPTDYISDENAAWLIECIDLDGHVGSETELELLVKVLEKANTSPEKLVAYALKQVKFGVLEGTGPTRHGLELAPGEIGEAEVDLLRRILYAFGGDKHLAISRTEAEVLFDLNDATYPQKNHVSWSDLFVKAVTNFMMATSGYQPPTREVALKREAWLNERDGISVFMNKMASGGLQGIFAAYTQSGEPSVAEKHLEATQNNIQISECVTESETLWLVDRIGRNGKTNENERTIIEFVKSNSPSIHPSFKTMMGDVA